MSTKTVLVPLATGFEEIEAITIIDVLRRAEIEVTSASLDDETMVRGAHGVELRADCSLSSVAGKDFDLIALPGGMPGAQHLHDHAGLQARLSAQRNRAAEAAAICAAPMALSPSGYLEGRQATCYPGFEDRVAAAEHIDAPVVSDGPVTTSRGVGTALPFALALVARLVNQSKADELAKAMLV